ncbi:hypothetical protein MTO96_041694, partial [Rhipicephalus appendiculatus]
MLGSSLMWTMLAVLGRRRRSLEYTARLVFYVSMGAFVGVLSCTLRMTRPKGSFYRQRFHCPAWLHHGLRVRSQ